MRIDLPTLIQNVISTDSPDLHLQVGQPPVIRLKTGDLSVFKDVDVLTKADIDNIIDQITTPEQREKFKNEYQVDFSFTLDNVTRFRINLFQEQAGPAISFRMISAHIPTFDEIGLDRVAKDLAMLPNGLVLIVGPTGAGKSTTLASMIEYINENRNSHIITIEDPIEFVFKSKKSLITQRELNAHTKSFTHAIKGALRQDPDVVMVGEMRDLETISAAITLAETGHLVLSTLHTRDAAQTINRMIDVFPAYQQQQIRAQLGSSLRAVISQNLIPRADGQGRVAAREVMLVSDAIRNCILTGQTQQIYSVIQISAGDGMILMDKALEDLFRNKIITKDQALAKAMDIDMLSQKLDEDE
jgi:twitching motility protein PilT